MNGGTLKRLMIGGLAGFSGAAAMRLCVSLWDTAHGDRSEYGPFGIDPEADRNAARRMCELVSQQEISDADAEALGTVFHFALGAGAGAVYPFLPRGATSCFGLAYGFAVWLIGDLLAVSVSRVSDPRSKTISSHTFALATHLLFGAVVHAGTSQASET